MNNEEICARLLEIAKDLGADIPPRDPDPGDAIPRDTTLQMLEIAIKRGMALCHGLMQQPPILPGYLFHLITKDVLEKYGPELSGATSWVNAKGVVKLPPFVVEALGLKEGGGVIFHSTEKGLVIISNDQFVAEQLDRALEPDEDPAP